MKRYFKHQAESELGAGTVYLETKDGWPTRQVEVYGSIYRWGDETHPEGLADQPLEVLGLDQVHEITAAEFEEVWSERCRQHL